MQDDTTPEPLEPSPELDAAVHTWNAAPPPSIVCMTCGRPRTVDDWYDYHPIQAMTGRPLGWYSGDDGEMCGQCMTRLMAGTLRDAGLPATPERTDP